MDASIPDDELQRPLEQFRELIEGSIPPIHKAVENGEFQKVVELVERDRSLLHQECDHDQPIHIAAWQNRFKILKFLIEHGADVNAVGDSGFTPLHYAAKHGNLNCAKLLVESGSRTDPTDNRGFTPLYYTAWNHEPEGIAIGKLLLEKGAQLDIHSAIGLGKWQDVAKMLQSNPNLIQNDPNRDDIIHEIVVTIQLACPEFDEKCAAALSKSAQESEWFLRLCREHGAPIDTTLNPLQTSVSYTFYGSGIAEVLVNLGADVNWQNQTGKTALDSAKSVNNQEAIDFLRRVGGKTGEELTESRRKQ